MYGGIIKKIHFFDGKDPAFIGLIVPLLSPLFVEADDFIFRKGNHPNYVFFIVKGWSRLTGRSAWPPTRSRIPF